jgi:hypothetical protein
MRIGQARSRYRGTAQYSTTGVCALPCMDMHTLICFFFETCVAVSAHRPSATAHPCKASILGNVFAVQDPRGIVELFRHDAVAWNDESANEF